MLYFVDACVSYDEIPNKQSLCIYISGCLHNCKDCHYPELKEKDYGDILAESFYQLVDLYSKLVECVCFMGEGACGTEEKREFLEYTEYIHSKNLDAALYSGRDLEKNEEWMDSFDYVKLGSYQPEKGSIIEKTTNQRLYKKENDKYIDITEIFWR